MDNQIQLMKVIDNLKNNLKQDEPRISTVEGITID
jgi:hypothetical protein